MALVKLLKLGGNKIPRQHNSAADELQMLSLQGGNIKLAGNSITSEDVDGNIILDPNGNGLVNINNAYTLPGADGTANQVLTTNGAGAVTFQDPGQAAQVCKAYTASGILIVYLGISTTRSSSFTKAWQLRRESGSTPQALSR